MVVPDRYMDPRLPRLLRAHGIDLVFDVGANEGQFAAELLAAGFDGRIVSFEPLSMAHARLQAAADVSERWLVAERCALGSETGVATLNVAGQSESSSLLEMLDAHRQAAPASRYVGTESVPLRTLDEMATPYLDDARSIFVKLDVQGYEEQVLQGATRLLQRVRGLQIEMALTPLYSGESLVDEWLPRMRQAGFEPWWFRPGFTDGATGRALQVDGIFFRPLVDRTQLDPDPRAARSEHYDDVLETFIIIHDQDLLLAGEREGRFSSLGRYRYLFVGDRDTDRVERRDDVIIARRLPDNIEDHALLLSFTGWYAVARNGLASTAFVALLEYDATPAPEFERDTVAALRAAHSIVGYVPVPLTSPMYLHATPWFPSVIERHLRIDASLVLRDYLAAGAPDRWAATTNQAMHVEDLAAFVDWFTPMTPVFQDDPIGSHVHERAVPLYCVLNEIDIACVEGVLDHDQRASHGADSRSFEEATRHALGATPLLAGADLYARFLQSQRALADEQGRTEHLRQILDTRNREFEEERRRLRAYAAAKGRQARAQRRRADHLRQANAAIRRSHSWRITEPLRLLGRRSRDLLGRLRR